MNRTEARRLPEGKGRQSITSHSPSRRAHSESKITPAPRRSRVGKSKMRGACKGAPSLIGGRCASIRHGKSGAGRRRCRGGAAISRTPAPGIGGLSRPRFRVGCQRCSGAACLRLWEGKLWALFLGSYSSVIYTLGFGRCRLVSARCVSCLRGRYLFPRGDPRQGLLTTWLMAAFNLQRVAIPHPTLASWRS